MGTKGSTLQSQTSSATVSTVFDTTSKGKKVLKYAAQRRDSAESDAVSEATEVFSNGNWRRASAQIPFQPHDRGEPINEEENSSEPLEVQRTSSISRRHTPYPEHLRSSTTRVKTIKLDIDNPEQVVALVWRFCLEGGAFLSCIREGAILPDNHGLEVGDELTYINGNLVHGLPRDEIEHAWMEIQDDESINFLELTLLGALEK